MHDGARVALLRHSAQLANLRLPQQYNYSIVAHVVVFSQVSLLIKYLTIILSVSYEYDYLLAVAFLYEREYRKSILDSLYRPPKPDAEEKRADGYRVLHDGRFDMPPFAVDLLTDFRSVNDALLKRLNVCFVAVASHCCTIC